MDADTYEFALLFTVVTCDSCGADGFADVGRCECGVIYDQGDTHVVARRRRVLSACGLFRPLVPPVGVYEPSSDTWAEMSAVTGVLMASIDEIAQEDESGAQHLADALGRLDVLQELVRSAPRLRPWYSSWGAVRDVLVQIEDVATSYLLALTVGTAPLAEEWGAAAQRSLDRAGELAAVYGERLDRWNDSDDESLDPFDSLPGLAAGAFHVSGAESMLDLDRLGQGLYARVTGSSEPAPGVGLQLQLSAFLASVLFDEEAFWRKAQTAYRDLSHDPNRLVSIVGSDEWLSAMGEAISELRDIAIEVGAVAASVADDRFEARSLIRLGGRLFEPIAVPLLAPLLVVRRKRDLHRLLNSDPNSVVKQTRDANRVELTEGILAALRDADAHGAYTLVDSGVAFTSKRAEVPAFDLPQLTDAVLAGLETVNALYTGLVCALVEGGVDPAEIETLFGLQFSAETKLKLALGFSGWTAIDISVDEALVSARGQGAFPENPLTLGGACSIFVDDVAEFLRLTGTSEGSVHTLEGPLAPMRAWSEADPGLTRDGHFLETGHLWSYDGEKIFSSAKVRKWIAVMAVGAMKGRGDPRSLRLLQKLAARLGDGEMCGSLGAAIRMLRAKATDTRVRPEDIAALDLLIEWEGRAL